MCTLIFSTINVLLIICSGAVKPNIGHLEGASGLAGLIKAILVLERAVIPPNMNYERSNIRIDTDFLKVQVPKATSKSCSLAKFISQFPLSSVPWPTDGLRRASVNSFGFGGTNAHVVIDDAYNFLKDRSLRGNTMTAPSPPSSGDDILSHMHFTSLTKQHGSHLTNLPLSTELESDRFRSTGPRLLTWSAPSKASLERLINTYANFFSAADWRKQSSEYLAALAYTLIHRRTMLSWRYSLVVDSIADVRVLRSDSLTLLKPPSTPVRVGFIFTGQGAQWPRMGCELLAFPTFHDSIRRAEQCVYKLGCTWSLIGI